MSTNKSKNRGWLWLYDLKQLRFQEWLKSATNCARIVGFQIQFAPSDHRQGDVF